MRTAKTILTLLVPSLVFSLVPLANLVATGTYLASWNGFYLWFASGLASAAAVTALCRWTPGRSWPLTALIIADAALLLGPCLLALAAARAVCVLQYTSPFFIVLPPDVILINSIHVSDFMVLHMMFVASAALLYKLPGRWLWGLLGVALAGAVALHTWQYDLVTAAGEGDLRRVRLLLAVYPDHAKKGEALMMAVRSGRKDVVHLLLERGTDADSKVDNWTPLITACSYRSGGDEADMDAIRRDLIAHGADVNWADRWGNTPLLEAAGHSLDAAKLLLAAGANPNARDFQGRTPLHVLAMQGTDVEMLKVMLEAGADMNARDNDGKTPLDLAAEAGYKDTADLLRRFMHPSRP